MERKDMPAAATADPRGLKRICPSCGTRYYDMNKRPVQCPNCKTEFTGASKSKPKRVRGSAANDEAEAKRAPEAETEEVERSDDTVSLEEVAEGEEDAEAEAVEGDDDQVDMDDEIEDIDDIDDDEEEIEVEIEDEK
jgi:uncharacterized protein (TIGR02300 family)